MNHRPTALVTGASGLLGRCLTAALKEREIRVLAQYHSHPVVEESLVTPLPGDLSVPGAVENFWREHRGELCRVDFFFNNYGPLTYKDTADLEYADFEADFSAHISPLVFLVRRMREQGCLSAVMASGVAEVRAGKGYRYILTQACAKAAMEMIIESWKQVWPQLNARYWPIPPLRGARFPRRGAREADPVEVAAAMVGALMDDAGEK